MECDLCLLILDALAKALSRRQINAMRIEVARGAAAEIAHPLLRGKWQFFDEGRKGGALKATFAALFGGAGHLRNPLLQIDVCNLPPCVALLNYPERFGDSPYRFGESSFAAILRARLLISGRPPPSAMRRATFSVKGFPSGSAEYSTKTAWNACSSQVPAGFARARK